MSITITDNVMRILQSQYQGTQMLQKQSIAQLVNDSWAYAKEKDLYAYGIDSESFAYCLMYPNSRRNAVFVFMKKRDERLVVDWMLHRVPTTIHPRDDRDKWNNALFNRYVGLRERIEELTEAMNAEWMKPDTEKVGPPTIDSEKLLEMVKDASAEYKSRPYLPAVFGSSEEKWIYSVVAHLVEYHREQYENGSIQELPNGEYLCATELTNANTQRLYLFISENAMHPYALRTTKQTYERYQHFDRSTIFGYMKGMHDNFEKSYPLLDRWGYINDAEYIKLAEMLPKEKWSFTHQRDIVGYDVNAIKNYIRNTFVRLLWEDKLILLKSNGEKASSMQDAYWAAFNTGLVDKRYNEIIAVFRQSERGFTPWRLDAFNKVNQGSANNFRLPPERAKYFRSLKDMCYDMTVPNAERPDIQSRRQHILYDRFHRLPVNVQKDYLGDRYEEYYEMLKDSTKWRDAKKIIDDKVGNQRRLEAYLNTAVETSINRAKWNIRTGVPMYYLADGDMTILLPLALEQAMNEHTGKANSDKELEYDLALVMKREEINNGAGLVEEKYIAKTSMTLDMAYRNARLVNRPDSDWLNPERIKISEFHDDGV